MNADSIPLVRVKAHYRQFLPIPKHSLDYFKPVRETIEQSDTSGNILFQSRDDFLRLCVLLSVVKSGKFLQIEEFSIHRLLDVYLGNDEVYRTLTSVNPEVTLITIGFSEFENRRKDDLMSHVFEQQIQRNKRVWIYAKGDNFQTKYPMTSKVVRDYATVLTLNFTSVTQSVSVKPGVSASSGRREEF